MTDAADRLLKDALALPDRDRAQIAARLLESLDAVSDEDPDEVEALWAAEIERRCDVLDAGTAKTHPWTDVRRELEAKYRAR
jgi:putative addiction module component (TIGR02574 family)